jgi:hypothetical protein
MRAARFDDTAAVSSDCKLDAGVHYEITDAGLVRSDGIVVRDWELCEFSVGVILNVPLHDEVFMEPAPAPAPAPGAPPAVAAPTVAPAAVQPAAPAVAAPPVEAAAAPAPAAPLTPPESLYTAGAESGTLAHSDVPAPADIAGMVKDSGQLGIVAAVIAVAGSAGAMKLYKSWSDNKKEIELKRLEVEAEAKKSHDYSNQQPPPCMAHSAAVDAKLAALDGEIAKLKASVEKSASLGMPEGFDPDDFEKWQKIVNSDLKALKAKVGKK